MPHLDRPFTLRSGVQLPHRVALAPLTNKQSNPDGTLHDDEFRWLSRRAGHFGLLSTCATFVSEEGHAWRGQLGIASEAHAPGLRRLATALSGAGCVPVVQLHHGGAKADQAPVKLSTVDGDGIRGATEADLERVIGEFVAGARRAEAAGFAGVEIHGANGYLFTQFLAPDDNPRTDAYGGSLENRARLLRRTLRAVRAATDPGFAVGVRISPVDVWNRRGLVLADGVALARWLAEDGADWVHLSLSDASGPPPHESGAPPVVKAVRDAVPPEVAVVAVGGIWTREQAEGAMDLGADVVALGRAGIAHPDWVTASRDTGFVPLRQPWDPAHLRAVDVGPGLLEYLRGFAGAVTDGKPARG